MVLLQIPSHCKNLLDVQPECYPVCSCNSIIPFSIKEVTKILRQILFFAQLSQTPEKHCVLYQLFKKPYKLQWKQNCWELWFECLSSSISDLQLLWGFTPWYLFLLPHHTIKSHCNYSFYNHCHYNTSNLHCWAFCIVSLLKHTLL